MIERRPFNELAGEDRDWLKARHHFRFSGGDNSASMGWGSLRIWNDDEIAPGAGFPPHAHANMEIITYVREGAVTHRDSLGNEGKTKAGDVQVMSAGTGIRHAEYNTEQVPALIFQIWITPDSNGGPPTWGSQPFPKADRSGRLVAFARLAASKATSTHCPFARVPACWGPSSRSASLSNMRLASHGTLTWCLRWAPSMSTA